LKTTMMSQIIESTTMWEKPKITTQTTKSTTTWKEVETIAKPSQCHE
jgi:hypothetical protein